MYKMDIPGDYFQKLAEKYNLDNYKENKVPKILRDWMLSNGGSNSNITTLGCTEGYARSFSEKDIQRSLTYLFDAEREVQNPAGIIDLLTPTRLIEVKKYNYWKEGLGQCIAYGYFFPGKIQTLILFDIPQSALTNNFETIVEVCSSYDIRVCLYYPDGSLFEFRKFKN